MTENDTEPEKRSDQTTLVGNDGGFVRCECGFSVRFDGDESYEEAREKWQTKDHREGHYE